VPERCRGGVQKKLLDYAGDSQREERRNRVSNLL
jgi:hypothetical protein